MKGSELSDDPFDFAPTDDAWEPEPEPVVEAPKKAPAKKAAPKAAATTESDSKIVLTFKEGAGFDASWAVVHAGSVEEASSLLDEKFAALLDKTKKVASYFRGGDPKAAGSKPAGNPGSEPPAGTPPAPGPDWTFKSGIGKNGKVWKAWMPPRGSDEQPVWLR